MKRFERLYTVQPDNWGCGWAVMRSSLHGNLSVHVASYSSKDVANRVACFLMSLDEQDIDTIRHREQESAWVAEGGTLT